MLNRNKNKNKSNETDSLAKTDDSQTREVIPAVDGQYEMIKKSAKEIQAIITANLGEEGFGPEDLDVVKTPSGGNTMWEVPTEGGIEHMDALEGIIIGSIGARSYWEIGYEESRRSGVTSPPDCFSSNMSNGIGDPGVNCATCKWNEFETAKTGKGKACKEQKRLFLMRQDQIIPLIVRAAPTSLKSVKKYMIRLLSRQQHISSVYTSITLEKVEDTFDYSRIILTKIGDVEDKDKSREFANFFMPMLKRVAEEDLKEHDS